MQQRFNLQLFQGTTNNDVKHLGVSTAVLNDILIKVIATIDTRSKPYLWLDYRISLPEPLLPLIDWKEWQPKQVIFTDFLWEKTCLECFIQPSGQLGYIEINAAPSGEFAVYEFSAYRTPCQLPPKPLLLKSKLLNNSAKIDNRAAITWQNGEDLNQSAATLQRKFGVDLSQIPNFDAALPHFGLSKLQPCVILSFGNHPLYFAPNHASPPDFHNATFWQAFNLES